MNYLEEEVSTASDRVQCPICRTEKHRDQATCSKCGVKSCPNAHVFSSDLTRCPQCGWEEHGWEPVKQASIRETTTTKKTEAHDIEIIRICPKCDTEIDSKTGRCPHCGYLKAT